MSFNFSWGNFREEDKSVKKLENYPNTKFSTFVDSSLHLPDNMTSIVPYN